MMTPDHPPALAPPPPSSRSGPDVPSRVCVRSAALPKGEADQDHSAAAAAIVLLLWIVEAGGELELTGMGALHQKEGRAASIGVCIATQRGHPCHDYCCVEVPAQTSCPGPLLNRCRKRGGLGILPVIPRWRVWGSERKAERARRGQEHPKPSSRSASVTHRGEAGSACRQDAHHGMQQ